MPHEYFAFIGAEPDVSTTRPSGEGHTTCLTVKLLVANPLLPDEFVTEAVMTCVPAIRAVVVNVEPAPMLPCIKLDVQTRLLLRFPCGTSTAEPVKRTGFPESKIGLRLERLS